MRVTPDMEIGEVLRINEYMIDAFTLISDSFEPLKNPTLTLMSDRITVAQAAHIGKMPLTEALYALNLTAGEDEKRLRCELALSDCADIEAPRREFASQAARAT